MGYPILFAILGFIASLASQLGSPTVVFVVIFVVGFALCLTWNLRVRRIEWRVQQNDQVEYLRQVQSDTDAFIRQVAGRSPAQEIADAKALLDSGVITTGDFEKIKDKALA